MPEQLAYIYDYVNYAHPFREGNGRTQREFFAQLLSESGHGIDWGRIDMAQLHEACHLARNEDDVQPFVTLMRKTLTTTPRY